MKLRPILLAFYFSISSLFASGAPLLKEDLFAAGQEKAEQLIRLKTNAIKEEKDVNTATFGDSYYEKLRLYRTEIKYVIDEGSLSENQFGSHKKVSSFLRKLKTIWIKLIKKGS